MKEEYQLLHQELLRDIDHLMQQDLPDREKMESCFWKSHKSWERLKVLVTQHGWKNEEEEIEFFREIKPHFTCYLEYFIILCESVQFVPTGKNAAIEFWKHEEKRLARFCTRHRKFLDYYESGDSDLDAVYFVAAKNALQPILPQLAFDNDQRLMTSHDPVVRSYLANKKYNEYVKMKLKELNH